MRIKNYFDVLSFDFCTPLFITRNYNYFRIPFLLKMKKIHYLHIIAFILILSSCGERIPNSVIESNLKQEQLLINQKEIFQSLYSNYLTKNIYQDSITLNSQIAALYPTKECLWSNGEILNKSAKSLISMLKNAHSYGLDSSFFDLDQIVHLKNSIEKDTGNNALLEDAEWQLSKMSIEFYSAIKAGFLNHEDKDSLYFQIKYDSLKKDDISTISHCIKTNKLEEGVDSLEPQFFEFKELRKSWGNFVADRDFSHEKINVETLKKDSVEAYKKAISALVLYGYIDTSISKTNQEIIEVLKEFQLQHGLTQDGRIGSATANALSRSNNQRRLAAMTSIEKMKWNPIKEDTLFYANIPAYSLKVIENNKITREYRTVVGKTINRTPEFSAKMNYLIINPFWHLPNSISSKEVLPKLKADSNLARKKGYKIYDKNRNVVDATKVDWSKVSQSSFNYKISQTRSGRTALGKVKFIFSNKYSIYFHDTPSKRLFKNDIRAYSHGCVRVQNPLDLAQYMLSRQDDLMTKDSVEKFTKRGIQKKFNLNYNMMVHIRYYSCEGTAENKMIFYRDIYKKEKTVKNKIEEIIAENQNKKSL